MGQLTGGVAHDFNNLLTAISGSLELLEPSISDDRSLRLLHTAQRGVLRGAKLTEALLRSPANNGSPRFRPMSIPS